MVVLIMKLLISELLNILTLFYSNFQGSSKILLKYWENISNTSLCRSKMWDDSSPIMSQHPFYQ